MKTIPRFSSLMVCFAGYLSTYIIVTTIFHLAPRPGENILFLTLALDLAATILIFLLSLIFNNSSFYDPYWSLAPVPIILAWIRHDGNLPGHDFRQWIITALILAWSFRLTFNWIRRWKGLHDEDWRYAMYRSYPRPVYWLISLAGFHLFPTLIVFAGCLSVYPAICCAYGPPRIIDVIALSVTLAGIAVEAIADQQLKAFINKKKGNVFLTKGLWKYSRHPNYLGEILFWTGLFIFSLQVKPFHWYTLAGPACMILMFSLISVPMMDKRMKKHKPGYAEYARKTGALVPWTAKR